MNNENLQHMSKIIYQLGLNLQSGWNHAIQILYVVDSNGNSSDNVKLHMTFRYKL